MKGVPKTYPQPLGMHVSPKHVTAIGKYRPGPGLGKLQTRMAKERALSLHGLFFLFVSKFNKYFFLIEI